MAERRRNTRRASSLSRNWWSGRAPLLCANQRAGSPDESAEQTVLLLRPARDEPPIAVYHLRFSQRDQLTLHTFAALLDELCNETGPAGLVAGAYAGPIVSVKVFVEMDVVAPVRVLLELAESAKHRSSAVARAQEDARQPTGDLRGDIPQRSLAS